MQPVLRLETGLKTISSSMSQEHFRGDSGDCNSGTGEMSYLLQSIEQDSTSQPLPLHFSYSRSDDKSVYCAYCHYWTKNKWRKNK